MQTIEEGNKSLDDFKNLGKIVKADVYHRMKLGERQQMVLDCLRSQPDGLTDKGIAIMTGLSLSCVCGRRNELMHIDLVIPYSIETYDGGDGTVPNIVWGVK
ncbi:MAG: hypothetical protein MUP17_04930 [candidate division Zixibacteria bacterium]|nr:hypothetical protein [candidate division Zixibacteria bacterium]